jgi:glyoxylase-like metal-dependent hydrolase (beta-lactamase superfamily II)
MDAETYQFSLGSISCTSIMDGEVEGKAREFFGNAPEEALVKACCAHGIANQVVVLPVICLVVDTGDRRLLLDTGCGTGAGQSGGGLLQGLHAVGIAADSIDYVLLSHGHWDHTGGNVDVEGSPAFADARYVMWTDEWDWLVSAHESRRVDEAEAHRIQVEFLSLEDRVELVQRETELLPGVELLAAPGHSTGHMAVMLSSEGERLLCIADAAVHPIHVEHPDWYMTFDLSPGEALKSRHHLFRKASVERSLVFGPHFAFPGLGHISDRGGYWQWSPWALEL